MLRLWTHEEGHDEQKEKGDVYPYSTNIEGYTYRWNYFDDIQRQRNQPLRARRKRQHLLSIVHVDSDHPDNLKPLCGVPLLLNLHCESRVNLFTLQKHFLCDIARIIIDDDLYESVAQNERHSIQFEDECIKKYCDLMVRRQFDTQNVVCLRFEPDQIHNFKAAFSSTIGHCRKHISAPPTSMEWTPSAAYTEKKMVRLFQNKRTMKLRAKPTENGAIGGAVDIEDNKQEK